MANPLWVSQRFINFIDLLVQSNNNGHMVNGIPNNWEDIQAAMNAEYETDDYNVAMLQQKLEEVITSWSKFHAVIRENQRMSRNGVLRTGYCPRTGKIAPIRLTIDALEVDAKEAVLVLLEVYISNGLKMEKKAMHDGFKKIYNLLKPVACKIETVEETGETSSARKKKKSKLL